MGCVFFYSTRYLGKVYTEYVQDLSPADSMRSRREDQAATDLATQMQHDFNMKLAETVQKEESEVREQPVYAEVGRGKKARRKERFESEDMDATIDAAFAATFGEDTRTNAGEGKEAGEGAKKGPVMGAGAAIIDMKKKEKKKHHRDGGERREKRRREKEKRSVRTERQDEDGVIEAVHERNAQVCTESPPLFCSIIFTLAIMEGT